MRGRYRSPRRAWRNGSSPATCLKRPDDQQSLSHFSSRFNRYISWQCPSCSACKSSRHPSSGRHRARRCRVTVISTWTQQPGATCWRSAQRPSTTHPLPRACTSTGSASAAREWARPSEEVFRRAPSPADATRGQSSPRSFWEAADRGCGQRLKALIPVLVDAMENIVSAGRTTSS